MTKNLVGFCPQKLQSETFVYFNSSTIKFKGSAKSLFETVVANWPLEVWNTGP